MVLTELNQKKNIVEIKSNVERAMYIGLNDCH